MTGIAMVRKVEDLKKKVYEFGGQIVSPRYFNQCDGEIVAVIPRDDQLPLYSRDAEVFTGTLEQLELWLQGIKFYEWYLRGLHVITPAKIEKAEQRTRNKALIDILKTEMNEEVQ